ncbi:hypothetical protein [Nocardiopsis sp. NRRL B-16309]|uniref:hypothetical protein n=1 Tax=Nocardiopsis sp. NRRL B-16309 TaxID=1519494 RepID=UPI0006AEFEB3|nr:hypothetical protein [Nocardiopsis sp. NRRL B-16309]KOX10177.1 hypothetical protein ADL05_26250 [Nocardiopsis sp. NRRL B-16309]
MDKDEALEALDTSTRKYRRTEKAHEEAREAAITDVLNALRAGARPTDVTNRSPFTAAYVRKLARLNHIEPAKK